MRRWPRTRTGALALALGAALALAACTGDASPSRDATRTEAAAGTAAWAPSAAEKSRATRLADGLSLPELAGQLIIGRSTGDAASLRQLRDLHLAGLMVTAPDIRDVASDDPLSQVKAFNADARRVGEQRGVPVMLPIDQEGGVVTRIGAPMTRFPSFMSAGAALRGGADPSVVADAARASGAEVRAAGFNVVYAPDADTTVGPRDPVIRSRSAAGRTDLVTAAVKAAVRGYDEAGVISTLKHFPGHDVTQDSHATLPRLYGSADEVRRRHMAPFAAAIEAGAPSVMTGHLDVRGIDPGEPSSTSRTIVTGELRERLGFDGLVVSDALGMKGVAKAYGGGTTAVAAIKAGNDLALMPNDAGAAQRSMLKALRNGSLPEAQARASAARTIAWLLHAESSPTLDGTPGSHEDASRALSAAAITRVAGPCRPSAVTAVRPSGDADAVRTFTRVARDAGLRVGSGTSVVFTGYGGRAARGDVVVATDAPWVLGASRGRSEYALYGSTPGAMRALVAVLQGRADAPGRLPTAVAGATPPDC